DVRLDAQPGQQPSRGVAVIAPVGVQLVGQFLGPAPLAPDLWEVEHQGDNLPVVAGVRPRRADGQRRPVPVHQQRVLGALFPAVQGAGAGALAAAEGPDVYGVDDGHVGVELIGLPQQPQQVGVQAVPDAQVLPVPQAAVGSTAGAAQLRGHVLPAAAGDQDEPNDLEGDPMADAWPPALGADGLLGG